MLERVIIRNFKRFRRAEIELGEAVVFIGPNNAGKTTALQALALWDLGVRKWSEKRIGDGRKKLPTKRSGVTLNRRDLVSLPVPETNQLWRGLHVRQVTRVEGKQHTENVRFDIEVRGVTDGKAWSCGLEFDHANPESLYCRPMGWADGERKDDDPIPEAARGVRVSYLQPMSGLAANEILLPAGTVQTRLGEGRTAEVLRNLCHSLHQGTDPGAWQELVDRTRGLFGVELHAPEFIQERGELTMSYEDAAGTILDVSASGRGLQQTVLLLAFLLGNRGAVLLVDEPDAHLEFLRQRQIYNVLTEVARSSGAQVIAASHSEVILNEAADRDVVVAFVGAPHRIDDRGSQVAKSLKLIGFEDYVKAEEAGWVLYLEGATDLAILSAFARTLQHPAAAILERPFVKYIENQPQKAREHFYGVRVAKEDLVGMILTDNLGRVEDGTPELPVRQWSRREIENYLCFPDVLRQYTRSLVAERDPGPLFAGSEEDRFEEVMTRVVEGRIPPVALRNRSDRWWTTVKASDEFLDPVFEEFFKELGIPNLMRKSDYHRLAALVPSEEIDPEVTEILDAIVEVAGRAAPVREEDGE